MNTLPTHEDRVEQARELAVRFIDWVRRYIALDNSSGCRENNNYFWMYWTCCDAHRALKQEGDELRKEGCEISPDYDPSHHSQVFSKNWWTYFGQEEAGNVTSEENKFIELARQKT